MGWSGKKELIQIPSVGYLKYDRFKQNVKQNNFIEKTLKALSCNIDDNYHPSSTINLCRYLAENYEEEFISAAGDSGLTFSGQMSAVETASMMSDVGLNISQLRILLRILRNKLGAKMFEPENVMTSLSGDMILPKFGEYKYNNMEKETKPEHILFWVRDTVAVFKKETQMLIDSGDIDILNISRIDIVVGGDHGQGAFRFPMKILYIMKDDTRHESIQPVGYILCKKDNGIILKNTIIKDLGDSINSLKEEMSFNNQQLSSSNIYVTGDLAFLVILLGKEHSSPHWCIKCQSTSKDWKLSNHTIGDEWSIENLKLMYQSEKKMLKA